MVATTCLWSNDPASGPPKKPPRLLNGPLRRRPSGHRSGTQDDSREIAAKRHAVALEDPTLLSQVSFGEIGLSPTIVRSLDEMGLKQLTEIQARCYARAVDGQNLVGQSRTGSGNSKWQNS